MSDLELRKKAKRDYLLYKKSYLHETTYLFQYSSEHQFVFFVGVKILFRIALVLLKHSTAHLEKIPKDFYDLLGCLKIKNMPAEILQPDFLIEEVSGSAVWCSPSLCKAAPRVWAIG